MTRDYDQELQELAKRLSVAEMNAAQYAGPALVEPLNRLESLYLFYRYLVERGIAATAPKGIRILYAKIANCLIGILRLLQAGQPGPAAMVLRSLFETAVNLQVILKEDAPARSQLFEDYIFVERGKAEGTEAQKAANKAALEKVRANYHPTHPYSWCWKIARSKKKKNGIPDNPNLRELCEHIGHPEYWEQVYGLLSAAIHPVPSYEMWMLRPDGQMDLGSHFGPQIVTVSRLSLALGADCLVSVIQFLMPEDEKSLCAATAIIAGLPI
jgi:hypothetical protein